MTSLSIYFRYLKWFHCLNYLTSDDLVGCEFSFTIFELCLVDVFFYEMY